MLQEVNKSTGVKDFMEDTGDGRALRESESSLKGGCATFHPLLRIEDERTWPTKERG